MQKRTSLWIGVLLAAGVAAAALLGNWGQDDAGVREGTAAPQILRRGNGAEATTLDPARADDISTFNVLADLYEGLLASAADGTPIPGVAENQQVSSDGLTYTFTLRADARWSNGDAVVAGDFVRAFRRLTNPDTASSYAGLLSPIQNFDAIRSGELEPSELGVTAMDDRTLEIRLHSPTGHFLSLLTMAVTYPIHSSANTDTFADPAAFVGNGAYVLVERQALSVIRMHRNEYYWDAENVSIDEIQYFPIDDETAEMNMYRAGELDITYAIPGPSIDLLRQSIPDEVRIAPRLSFYYMGFDMTQPPLDNRDLRRALSMAVDRRQLVQLIGRGELPAYGYVPTGTSNHVAAPYDWRNLNDADRIAEARAAYAAAGYGPDAPLTVGLMFDSGSIHERIALIVSSMWEDALGVEIRLEKREYGVMLETRPRRDEWDIMRLAWAGDYDDPLTFLEIFRSDSSQNLAMYANPEYDELLDRAAIETDSERRLQLMTEAEAMVLDDYPLAPLYFYVSKHLVKPHVGGFEDNALDRHPSRFLTLDAGN